MRTTEKIIMPLPSGATLLHPERALLYWSTTLSIDIGRLCYLRRSFDKYRRAEDVDDGSLDETRVEIVRKVITYLSDCARGPKKTRLRPATTLHLANNFTQFVDWMDSTGKSSIPTDIASAAPDYDAYSKWLRKQVALSALSPHSARHRQRGAHRLLAHLCGDRGFGIRIRNISVEGVSGNPTQVPDDQAQALNFAWCKAIFESVCTHILGFKPYPYCFESTDPNSGGMKRIWMLPTTLKQTKPTIAWNLESGEIRSPKELKTLVLPGTPKQVTNRAYSSHAHARITLEQVNGNRYADARVNDAFLATYCFAQMFAQETGQNLGVLTNLGWSPEINEALSSPHVVRQNYRAVKYRASGKIISFEVSANFIPMVKTYMKLRQFLLRDAACDKLLIGPAGSSKRIPGSLALDFIKHFQKRLDTLKIPVRLLGSRQTRAAKQDYLVRNHGPEVAAEILGHTFETAIKKYTNGTASAHRAEWSAFLNSLEMTVLPAGRRDPGDIESAVGECHGFKKPKPISVSVLVKPDCQSSEGCLFCDKYRVHVDEKDVRKLVSCRHCIRMSSKRAASLEEYDQTFGAVLRRIDFLLGEIRKRDANMVGSIEIDVDENGNLDDFWAGKRRLLVELNLV